MFKNNNNMQGNSIPDQTELYICEQTGRFKKCLKNMYCTFLNVLMKINKKPYVSFKYWKWCNIARTNLIYVGIVFHVIESQFLLKCLNILYSLSSLLFHPSCLSVVIVTKFVFQNIYIFQCICDNTIIKFVTYSSI